MLDCTPETLENTLETWWAYRSAGRLAGFSLLHAQPYAITGPRFVLIWNSRSARVVRRNRFIYARRLDPATTRLWRLEQRLGRSSISSGISSWLMKSSTVGSDSTTLGQRLDRRRAHVLYVWRSAQRLEG
jgi:hypothetical protein